MGVEGIPAANNTNEKEQIRDTAEWNSLYKKQLAYYGSPENAHTIQLEFKEDLESGEITFHDALIEYAKQMTDSVYRMNVKMRNMEEQKRSLYGGEEE